VPRLTKSDIENALLTGAAVHWNGPSGKSESTQLTEPKQRRLFQYLLTSKVREVKGLSKDFVDRLETAYSAAGDPGAPHVEATINPKASGPWKLQAIRSQNFGGVNIWNGTPFELLLDGESLILEGPNGSGKSSLTAAIIWALSGDRPRDQGDGSLTVSQPVFDASDKRAGFWPPVAAYPPELADLQSSPAVTVEVVLVNPFGKQASIVRHFDGKNVSSKIDPELQIPSILIEAGLLMPARMAHLRLDAGRGQLTEAVQKLTGLDDLIVLGAFVQGLCHRSRDYLAYKTAELATASKEFDKQIERARTALAPVGVAVDAFKPADAEISDGPMAKFGEGLNETAAELFQVISSDLSKDLDLSDAKTQNKIVVTLAAAEADLQAGLGGLATWKKAQTIASHLPAASRTELRKTIVAALGDLEKAVAYQQKQQDDAKYRLKAAGAHWHAAHREGDVKDCPLCDGSLVTKPGLAKELDVLRAAGEAATRRFADNLVAIMAELEDATPQPLRRLLTDQLPTNPRVTLANEYRQKLVDADRLKKCLVKLGSLAESAIATMPAVELAEQEPTPTPAPAAEHLVRRLDRIELLCAYAEWFETEGPHWNSWWAALTPAEDSPCSLTAHLKHLSKSLSESMPYRIGADAIRIAISEGKTAAAIEREQNKRQEIADALDPLKKLGNMAEAQARDAINELSDRISQIHSTTYIADRLKFRDTSLDKKTGLVVRGEIGGNMRIDATLIANASWLRAILWAFVFALREEAVSQIGGDIFPFMLFDDPQQTFDTEHRGRWAEQIAHLQKGSPEVQIFMGTYDEGFLALLPYVDVTGRRALIGILDGDRIARLWKKANAEKTPDAARDFMKGMREYVERVLRLMLRGVDPDMSAAVLGDCRQKIADFHKAGIEPWNRPAFNRLLAALSKGSKEIKWIEEAHHTTILLGMNEAVDVEKHWRERLEPALMRAYRTMRDHWSLHGSMTALHALPPSVELPEGYKAKLREYKLPLLGTAAALTDGRIADGCVELNFTASGEDPVELKDHFAYRLLTPTLEPVARAGDILVVRDHAQATSLSLVVARHEDRLLARRLQVADNHSDIAVLSASSINPRETAPPIVAKMPTLTLKKVVGVLYGSPKLAPGSISDMEIADLSGEASIASALSGAKGLIEVVGRSAEPMALEKQYLIIGDAIGFKDAAAKLDGQPVVAEASDNARYFKRLRVMDNAVILESLEIGGNFEPVMLSKAPGLMPHIVRLWPVIGMLFEKM
jgi:hypothetical protein